MNPQKRILSLLLCAALLALSGCGGKTPPETTQGTQNAVTTEPSATESPAKLAYEQARTAIDGTPDLILRITADKTTSVGGERFMERTDQTLSYSGLGSDALQIHSEEQVDYNSVYEVSFEEIYSDGTLYVAMDNAYFFSGSMTQEECTGRYLPAVLLDSSLYGSFTEETAGSSTLLTFSDPVAAEGWAVPEAAELLEASGTALLSASGELRKTTYSVSYAYGSVEVLLEISMYINPEPVEIQVPENGEDYLPMQNVDALRLSEQATGYLLQAEMLSVSSLESVFSEAGGVVRNQSTTADYYAAGKAPQAKISTAIYLMDYSSGQNQELNQEELYLDGVYTISVDGSDPMKQNGVTDDLIVSYCLQIALSHLVSPGYYLDADLTDLGSTYLVEWTMNEAFGNALRDSICTMLYDDAAFLDNFASAYAVHETSAYLALDKYTGLPTAAGYRYEGHHTIEGEDYLISVQSDQSIDVPGLSAYKSITASTLPEEEPAVKATPLFYHVTGCDGQEMWLFGTIHVGDERTGFLPQEIYDAFRASDALALEFDSGAFEAQLEEDEAIQDAISEAYYYADGTTVKDHIDETVYEAAISYMKASGNYNVNTDYLKPSIWSSCIENFFLRQGYRLSADKGVEDRLEKLAEEQGKPILDVESAIFQIQMMTGYSDELQEYLLSGTVSASPVEYWDSVSELYELWCRGDEAAMREALTDDTTGMSEEELALYGEYKKAMETDRNAGMLQTAIGYLESGDVVFYAVGLAHLLAEDGLVNTLRDAGYAVELVSFG